MLFPDQEELLTVFHPMKLYSHGKCYSNYQSMLKINKGIKLKKKINIYVCIVRLTSFHTSITV